LKSARQGCANGRFKTVSPAHIELSQPRVATFFFSVISCWMDLGLDKASIKS